MKRAYRSLATLACLALVALSSHAATPEFRDFDARSMAALKTAHAGKPFVLAFWSIHCGPCLQEVSQWGPLKRRYPNVPIVLVATDQKSQRAKLARVLAPYDVKGVELWAFADPFEERVRFAVDPRWRGELPRTYLFDGTHAPEVRSGPADLAWIEPWLKRQTAAAK